MIKIENIQVVGWEAAIRGMRNPMNSWEKSDSKMMWTEDPAYMDIGRPDLAMQMVLGENDLKLMMKLAKAGSTHAKYRRMIVCYLDVVAPLYWHKEAETYKVGTVCNSCSTMHKIHAKEFELDDFSHEKLRASARSALMETIKELNKLRAGYNETKNKNVWYQMIQLLPSSYNQRRTLMLNYEVLSHMYFDRKDHKLDCWREFCRMIETLPYSQIITLKGD